ncbi:enolase C-terminal domain-like protein [Gilvimarinus algae]|uniref:Enolase C-terminal domain-like protein n=1 Tax=Gilvimarinus algae TaxID=3058037 RepID=A0ABT8THD6_9GAMM|nr:enolase C-terminal domain-like protein [Gilvimarinus sp. SDUM040014]MDO3383510.1 enolase C-terminal domain-like protein [Gilvimarinus sp. SDUM040014]
MICITAVEVLPVAAPPTGFGADARNLAQGGPVYANVYLRVHTSDPSLVGHSIIFTNGRGLKEQCDLTLRMAQRTLLKSSLDIAALHKGYGFGQFVQNLMQDSDYAWLGSAGMSRMAAGAIINALWDLMSQRLKLPAWRALLTLTPEQLVSLIDFEPIADVLSPAEACAMLKRARAGLPEREQALLAQGLLAYNTAGWSGIELPALCGQVRHLIDELWPHIKIKVGAEFARERLAASRRGDRLTRGQLDDMAKRAAASDTERLLAVFATIDEHDRRMQKMTLAVDSNQVFDVQSALVFIRKLARNLYKTNPRYQIQWFEEPTNPHSALGHLQIKHGLQMAFVDCEPPLQVPISTGEQGSNPAIFKDLLFASLGRFENEKHSAIDVLQMDYCRVAGIADNLAILLLVHKARQQGHEVRLCPHAGGIGLCEGVRHIQAINLALFGTASAGAAPDILEYVAEPERSVHEGIFNNPAIITKGRYRLDNTPGVGVDYSQAGLDRYRLPDGSAWQESGALQRLAQELV